MANAATELPYEVFSDPGWNVTAAETWQGRIERQRTLIAEGACPRCTHGVSARVDLDVVLAADAAESIPKTVESLPGLELFTIRCECDRAHSDEQDKEGCGAAWNLIAVFDPNLDPAPVRFLPGRAVSLEDRNEAELRRELSTTELKRVRAAADKWKTGLAALLTLIATVSVVKGRDSISALDIDTQHAIIGALGVALALAVVASLLALRAANGPLKRDSLVGKRLADVQGEEVTKSMLALRVARGLTVMAVVLLALAVGAAWWGEEPTPGKILVKRTSDSVTLCGTFKSADANELRVETATGVTTPVALGDVKSVSFRQKC